MESMLPDETRKPRRGSPSTATLVGSVQSGWAMKPTRYPRDSSSLVMIAEPNEGWST